MASMDGNAKPLTAQQARFVEEYLKTLNQTDAYRIAYPKSSDASAQANATRLMANDGVREAIAAAQKVRAAKVELTQEWVLRRLMEEAEYTGEGASHSARVRATELCGKHLGMLADKAEVSIEEKRPVTVRVIHGTRDPGGRAAVLAQDRPS